MTARQDEIRPCLSGCMRGGRHLADCANPCPDECQRRCPDHCTGCVPRTATGDLLVCPGCERRIEKAVGSIPDLVVWIRSQDVPGARVLDDTGGGGGRKAPPAPLRLDAVDAADELHAMLASWCKLIVEEYPGDLRGPDLTGSVRSRRVLADQTGDTVGLGVAHLPRSADGRRTPGHVDHLDIKGGWREGEWVMSSPATERAAKWLTNWLSWALAQPWADEFVREVSEAALTAEARWPRRERPTPLPTACPGCGRRSLIWFAPNWVGAPAMIMCQADGCDEKVDEKDYDWRTRVILAEQHQARRVEKAEPQESA